MFKVNSLKTKSTSILVFLLLTLAIFHTFFSVSIVDFKLASISSINNYVLLFPYHPVSRRGFIFKSSMAEAVII